MGIDLFKGGPFASKFFDEVFKGGFFEGLAETISELEVAGANRCPGNKSVRSYIEEGHHIVDFDLPGMTRDNINISLDNSILSVKATAISANKATPSRTSNSFSYSVTLPDNLDLVNADADLDNGVLTTKFLLLPASPKSKISINIKK